MLMDGALRRGASRRSSVGRRSSAARRADERVFAAALGATAFGGRDAGAGAFVRARDDDALRGAGGAALLAADGGGRARAGARSRCGTTAAALRDGARAGAAAERDDGAVERDGAAGAAGETVCAAGETVRAAGETARAAGAVVFAAGALFRTFARSCAAMASEAAEWMG